MKYTLNLDWDAVLPLLITVLEEDVRLCQEEAKDEDLQLEDRESALEIAGYIQWLLDHYYVR